ncbi:MAG: tRNA (adenosine(37)-N6)-threonylcarbamoyltransferase complex ATPase subunit type 1 TsaE [Pseudomonadota bacterium]
MKSQKKSTITLADETATLEFGASLSPQFVPPLIIFLHGELGAGKTTLVRGMLRGMGFEGRVKSPTYALVEVYAISRLNLYHFDFYRLTDPDEWHEAGLRDLMNSEAICLIEWPEKALGAGVSLPIADLAITLSTTRQDQRQLIIKANTVLGQALLKKCG